MKKLFVTYGDGGRLIYTMQNKIDHMEYVNRHRFDWDVESIILQQYPKKDNEPIVIKQKIKEESL